MNRRNFFGNLLSATAMFTILPGAGRVWNVIRPEPVLVCLDGPLLKYGRRALPLWRYGIDTDFATRVQRIRELGDSIVRPTGLERGDFICGGDGTPELRWIRLLDASDVGPDGQPLSRMQNKGWAEDIRPDLHPKEEWQR